MDLTKATLTELKVLAYDQLAMQEQIRANLQAINAEIAKKTQAEAEIKATSSIDENAMA